MSAGGQTLPGPGVFCVAPPQSAFVPGVAEPSPVPERRLVSQTVGDLTATLEWAYADAKRVALKIHFDGWKTDWYVGEAQVTGADGSWTASTANLALPCVVRVTTATGEVLHSYIENPGTTNITPITELVVAAASGSSDTGAFFTNFSSVSAASASDRLALAITQVKQRLASLGVNADGLNLLNQKFNPRNGDNYDDRLEEIAAQLKLSNTTLAALSTDVGKGIVGPVGPSWRKGPYRVQGRGPRDTYG